MNADNGLPEGCERIQTVIPRVMQALILDKCETELKDVVAAGQILDAWTATKGEG